MSTYSTTTFDLGVIREKDLEDDLEEQLLMMSSTINSLALLSGKNDTQSLVISSSQVLCKLRAAYMALLNGYVTIANANAYLRNTLAAVNQQSFLRKEAELTSLRETIRIVTTENMNLCRQVVMCRSRVSAEQVRADNAIASLRNSQRTRLWIDTTVLGKRPRQVEEEKKGADAGEVRGSESGVEVEQSTPRYVVAVKEEKDFPKIEEATSCRHAAQHPWDMPSGST